MDVRELVVRVGTIGCFGGGAAVGAFVPVSQKLDAAIGAEWIVRAAQAFATFLALLCLLTVFDNGVIQAKLPRAFSTRSLAWADPVAAARTIGVVDAGPARERPTAGGPEPPRRRGGARRSSGAHQAQNGRGRAATVVASVTREREQPSAVELGAELDPPSAAELRVELALLRRTMETILVAVLVLMTIGLFVVLLVIGGGERVLARGVVVAIAVLGLPTTVLALQTLEVLPRRRRRSR